MPHSDANRLRQLERVLLIVELLAPLRDGATVGELTNDVRELFQGFGKRTIRRDLAALRRMGFVDQMTHRQNDQGYVEARWVWTDRSIRGVIMRHAAEIQASTSAD
ncbi:MAG: hypothetical protein AAGJ40_20430 [Planctomycetota bacterium]